MIENFDSKYWYDYVDIYLLLNDLCVNQYFVSEPTSSDNFHLSRTIQNACEQLNNNNHICAVVIPINIGFVNCDIYQGSHWVGLIIKLNSNKQFEAIFADSLGNPIDNQIITVLQTFVIETIDLSIKQQNNAYDCGPWTVLNLDSLAKTGKLPVNVDRKIILNQRLHLINLSESFDKSLLNIPDVIIPENPSLINQDIEKIKTIFDLIIKYENNQSDLRKTLIEIGKLAGELYYNDKGDKDSRCIRNKYGYIQRNKGKLINKNGIYFEKLYQLSVVLKNKEMYSSIPSKEFEELHIQLSNLKLKISYILKEEIRSVYSELHCDFTISIIDLIIFATHYYEILTIKKIREELENLESINFQIKDDRYYFARVFGIIGERINELLENQNDLKNHILWTALKNLIELRNKIIHFHKIIRDGVPNFNLLINDVILKVKSHLIELITNNEIDFNYSKVDDFNLETKTLMEYLFTKSKKTISCNNLEKEKKEKVKELSSEDIENLLQKLRSKACEFIESAVITKTSNETFKQKSIEKQLESLNKQYQTYLMKLNVEKREEYPISLEYWNKDMIIKQNQRIPVQSAQFNKNPESNSKKLKEKIGLFKLKILIMKDEVEYLLSLSDLRIFQRKYFFIIQQIMLVIGQLMKDIEDLKICEKKNEESLERENYLRKISPYFENFTASLLLYEGKVISKKSRNCLAHGLWSFDKMKFFEELKDILCVFPHLESFISIMEKDDLPLSVKMLHNIGVSFSEIGLYEEAIDYLNRALLKFDECPILISADDTNAKNYKLVFGLERPVYRIQRNLATMLLFAKRTSEAYKNLDEIKRKINHKALEKCNDNDLKIEVSSIYCDMSWFLKENRNYEEAIKILKDAERICEDFLTKINLAQAYSLSGRKEQAIELCEIIYKNDPDIVGKFQALELLIFIMLESSDNDKKVDQLSKYIKQMEDLLQNDIRSFKSLYRDKYLITKLILIDLESGLLIEKSYQNLEKGIKDRFDFDKLKKLDVEFNSILPKLKGNLISDRRVTTLFLDMCCCYCCIFNDANIDFDKEGENLIQAQNYFDRAVENINQFPELSIDILHDPAEAAVSLCRAYNNYVLLRTEKLEMKFRIEYLERALKLQQKYEITKITTLNNLGLQYLNSADKQAELYQNCENDEIYDLALKNYENAIKYYNWKLKEQYLEYKNLCENVELITDTKISLAYCYFGISSIKFDLFFMGETVNYFNDLLKLSFNEREKFKSYKSVIESLRLGVIEVLKDILNPMFKHNQLRNANPFAVKFCRKKFGIEIISDCGYLKWKIYKNTDLISIKYQVKQELDKTTEEFILLHKFYKILLTKGLFI